MRKKGKRVGLFIVHLHSMLKGLHNYPLVIGPYLSHNIFCHTFSTFTCPPGGLLCYSQQYRRPHIDTYVASALPGTNHSLVD